MFEKNKTVKVLAIVVACFLLAIVVMNFLVPKQQHDPEKLKVEVYFLNPATNMLEPEIRYIQKGEKNTMGEEVIKLLYQGPQRSNLAKTFPEKVSYERGQLVIGSPSDKSFLEIMFSPEYKEMSPTEELFLRSSLVYTMTGLGFINDVHIYVDNQELLKTNGQPMGLLNRSNIELNPVIFPTKVDTQTVKLYFLDKESKKLRAEERTIQVNPDRSIENYIVEELISGPRSSSLSPTLPAETKLRGDVKTDEGISYVNLSSDYVIKNTGSPETLHSNIYSVVNSLTELPNVKKVQFLIDSEKIDSLKGSIDLSNPLERDGTIILKVQ